MLSPRYLDGLSDEIIEIYSQLETDILQDMARRLARIGKVTDATKWQAQMLAEAGGLKKNIGRILAKYDKAIVKQIKDTFTDALETNARNDNRIFKAATGRTVSAPNAQQMLSTIQKCHSDLSRLTLTTAATTETQFVQQANRVYMQTQAGAFDYDTAMKNAADELSKHGITTVHYENGRPVTRSIESAVRMNILTSINQTAANQTLSNAEELGVEKFEVTAHMGARPEHEAWQGKIYTKQQLYTVCELGSVTGLCGINCKHSFYPYFEGMEEHYTQDDLDEMTSEKVNFNGQEMTRYEGEQKLRGIERNIRHYKREALTQEAAGVDNTKARRKLGEWQAAARDFTKQTGIARDRAREYVGTGGKQPSGIVPSRTLQPPAPTPTTKPTTTPTITPSVATAQATEEKLKTLIDNPKTAARTTLENLGVEAREIKAFEKPLTQDEIIKRIAGGDKTKGGSCSSVGLAYVANKAGFDVLDFRDGASKKIFSRDSTIKEIANLNGVKSIIADEFNDFKAARWLMSQMEAGKEYELAVGRHVAIVHKLSNGTFEYLELQSAVKNGFKPFDKYTLKYRFGCQQSHTSYKMKYKILNCMIDIESLGKSKEFIELMKYINTSESAQMKGIGGYAK